MGISRETFAVFDCGLVDRGLTCGNIWASVSLILTLPRALDHRDIDYIERNLRHFARGLICGLVGFRG